MQISRRIKGSLLTLMVLAALVMLSACTRANVTNPQVGGEPEMMEGNRTIEGYITDYDSTNGTITVDQIEFLTHHHTDRIEALGLDLEHDFPYGYYAHNENHDDKITLKLAEDVQIRFADQTYRQNDTRDHDGQSYREMDREQNDHANRDGVMDDMQDGATGLTDDMRDGATGIVGNTGEAMGDLADGVGESVRDLSNGSLGDSVHEMGEGVGRAVGDVGNAVGDAVDGVGDALRGVAGGLVGGLDMLTDRFRNGIDETGSTPYFITVKDGVVTHIEEVHAYSNFDLMYRSNDMR